MTTETVSRALWAISNLQQNLEQARKENRSLRSRTEGAHPYHYNTAGRILRRALDDANAMLVLRSMGLPTSRRYLYGIGISERRFCWALGLLRAARVVAPRGSAWLTSDVMTASTKLQAEYNRLKSQANALERLRLYMPKSRQYMYHGKNR